MGGGGGGGGAPPFTATTTQPIAIGHTSTHEHSHQARIPTLPHQKKKEKRGKFERWNFPPLKGPVRKLPKIKFSLIVGLKAMYGRIYLNKAVSTLSNLPKTKI